MRSWKVLSPLSSHTAHHRADFTTYSRKPTVNLLVSNRQGSTGSFVRCWPFAILCQTKNVIHKSTEIHKRLSTTAELHVYSVPPSSRAETSKIEAVIRRKAPGKSILRSTAGLKELDVFWGALEWYGKLAGSEIASNTSTRTPAGTLLM